MAVGQPDVLTTPVWPIRPLCRNEACPAPVQPPEPPPGSWPQARPVFCRLEARALRTETAVLYLRSRTSEKTNTQVVASRTSRSLSSGLSVPRFCRRRRVDWVMRVRKKTGWLGARGSGPEASRDSTGSPFFTAVRKAPERDGTWVRKPQNGSDLAWLCVHGISLANFHFETYCSSRVAWRQVGQI